MDVLTVHEDLPIEWLALIQLVDGSVEAAVYLDALMSWAHEYSTPVFFICYRAIGSRTVLNRKQQDRAIQKLTQKSWFSCRSDGKFGMAGLIFELDVPAIKRELEDLIDLLERQS